MQDKSKRPRNGKRKAHGLWCTYEYRNQGDIITSEGFYNNGVDYGFWIERKTEKIYYTR